MVEVELISYMFSSGGNKEIAEFRITELKALLRSTFRVLFKFESKENLKQLEDELFGSTSTKAKVSIKLGKNMSDMSKCISKQNMLPHKKQSIEAINVATKIKINFDTYEDKYIYIYLDILQLAVITGSMGKRSRKGFGSFKINKIELNNNNYEILLGIEPIEVFNKVLIKYENNETLRLRKIKRLDNTLEFAKYSSELDYNYVKKIHFIKLEKDIDYVLKEISELTHKRTNIEEFMGNENGDIDIKNIKKDLLGNHNNRRIQRFASPIHISFFESTADENQQYVVIKELNYDYMKQKLEISKIKENDNEAYVNQFVKKIKEVIGGSN